MRKLVCVLPVLVLFFLVASTFAIPTLDPFHPHNAATVHWERDGGPPVWGDTAHNHRDTCDFHGFTGTARSGDPYEAYAVWDCRMFRVDDVGSFDRGHGFINEWLWLGGGEDHIPRYGFDPADNMPAAAQAWVRQAFGEWDSISSDIANHIVGLAFREVSWTGGIEIQVHWHPDKNGNHGFYGSVSPNPNPGTGTKWDTENGTPVTLIFESDIQWWYGQKADTPVNEYHFYTVALHETGHVVGLDGQPDQQDIMYDDGFNPEPNGPCFDSLADSNGHAVHGARDLYMIELPPVGGVVVPVDKFGLLTPYIGLASTVSFAAVAAIIYVKRRKENQ